MTLRDYLALHHIKQSSFATTIGTSQAAVSRYCRARMPTYEHLLAITRATKGAVTAKDFVSDEFTRCGIGVSDGAGGPGIPCADVPPSAARPTTFHKGEEGSSCTR